MDNRKHIGENLRKLRGNRTQEEVAKAVNASVAAISMYEQGQRVPRDEIKLRLANYFSTTVEAIFFNYNPH